MWGIMDEAVSLHRSSCLLENSFIGGISKHEHLKRCAQTHKSHENYAYVCNTQFSNSRARVLGESVTEIPVFGCLMSVSI